MWFDLPSHELNDEVRADMEVLKNRKHLAPAGKFIRNPFEETPRFFQVGRVVEDPLDPKNRLNKRERRRTIAEELRLEQRGLLDLEPPPRCTVQPLDGFVQVICAYDDQHGAKDFLTGDLHIGGHMIDHSRTDIKAAFFAFHGGIPAIHKHFAAGGFRFRDVAFDPVLCFPGNDGTKIYSGDDLSGFLTDLLYDMLYFAHCDHC